MGKDEPKQYLPIFTFFSALARDAEARGANTPQPTGVPSATPAKPSSEADGKLSGTIARSSTEAIIMVMASIARVHMAQRHGNFTISSVEQLACSWMTLNYCKGVGGFRHAEYLVRQ